MFDATPVARATVIETMDAGVMVLDVNNRVLDIDPAFKRILGLNVSSVLARPVEQGCGKTPELIHACTDKSKNHSEFTIDVDGLPRTFEMLLSPLNNNNGALIGRLFVIHDITERKQVLQEYMNQQRLLAAKEERENFARDMHDNLGQALGFIAFQAQGIRQEPINSGVQIVSQRLDKLVNAAQGAHDELREYIRNARSPVLPDIDLAAELSKYLNDFREQTGIKVKSDIPPELAWRRLKPGIDRSRSRELIYTVIDGAAREVGVAETRTLGRQDVTTITVYSDIIREKLQAEGTDSVITLPPSTVFDRTETVLDGQVIKDMENAGAVLEIVAGSVTYSLPASHIDMDRVLGQFGQGTVLSDIRVNIRISKPPEDTVRLVEDIAGTGNLQLVMEPIEFDISCTCGDKTVEADRFSGFVERTVAIPDNVDPAKVTTAVVLNGDGTFSHVPTRIAEMDGRYYAVISSLTNSIYSIIWNTIEFNDVAGHWTREAVRDMGSRLVIGGTGEGLFAPDCDISRAEFPAIIVRALGLKPETADNPFNDIPETAWHSDCIKAAYQYGIVSGDNDGKYRPMDKITRKQVMTIIARSVKVVGLEAQPAAGEAEKILSQFKDKDDISEYAKKGVAACIKAGLVSGRSEGLIAPRDSITRAEVAVIVRRLLQKSDLI